MNLRSKARLALLCALLSTTMAGALFAPRAHAEESMFGYVYTTDLLPKGASEWEQWATWRHQQIGGKYDVLVGRTEYEYGLTDRLQVAMYANYTWGRAYHNGPYGATTTSEALSYNQPGPDEHYTGRRFIGVSGEAIYRFLSPYEGHGIGAAVYVEPTLGPGFRELETRLILQKNFLDDRLSLNFNATYAPEWRFQNEDGGGKSWNHEVDVNYGLAGSFRFRPNWSAGMEVLNEREYASYHFSQMTSSGYFLGPVLHYGGRRFFITATVLKQMPWASRHGDSVPGSIVGNRVYDVDFEKWRVRLKFGYYF